MSEVLMVGRPPIPVVVQRVFWQQVRAGVSVVDAGAVVGISRPSAQRLFSRAGGVIPSIVVEPSGRARRVVSFAEREEIACLRAGGAGVRAIARMLGRDCSVISRELARNSTASAGRYRASTAQQAAEARARRPKTCKLTANERLRAEVETRLKTKASPEQIAARLRHDFPEEPEMWVSHETIYDSLFVQGRGTLRKELTQALRTGRALRRPRAQHRAHSANARRERIKDMVMISDRPAEVTDRAVPGHWEGDLITGAYNQSAIGTLVERATRFVMLLHLPDTGPQGPPAHGAEAVQAAMITAMAQLPAFLRRTLTWDQGIEMRNHAQIAAATGLDIYFCDPASPWQRGTNENTNGLLRQYFPKGSDLSFHGPGLLENVASELNRRPRKTLGWRNPAEALDELLSHHDDNPGVATTT